MSETIASKWDEATWAAIMASVDRQMRLKRMSNADLADRLLAIWQDAPINSWRSDVLDEVMERLRAWDEPAESIQARIEARAEAELTDEDRATARRMAEQAVDRVKAMLDERND